MQITKTYTEEKRITIDVTLHDALAVIDRAFGFGEDWVNLRDKKYYDWKYDHPHNGAPQYDIRPATDEEIERYIMLTTLRKLIDDVYE